MGGAPSQDSKLNNVIDYVEIASTGNAVDFGDLIRCKMVVGGFSNGHGGL